MSASKTPRVRSTQLCACGCGEYTYISNERGKDRGVVRTWLRGHVACGGRPKLPQVKYGYRQIKTMRMSSPIALHRLRAEIALGKPLPQGCEVHHADGSRRDDAPLVICQDSAYHKLLHYRAKIKKFGGDPNRDLFCQMCRALKPKSEFYQSKTRVTGYRGNCIPCITKYNRRFSGKKAVA